MLPGSWREAFACYGLSYWAFFWICQPTWCRMETTFHWGTRERWWVLVFPTTRTSLFSDSPLCLPRWLLLSLTPASPSRRPVSLTSPPGTSPWHLVSLPQPAIESHGATVRTAPIALGATAEFEPTEAERLAQDIPLLCLIKAYSQPWKPLKSIYCLSYWKQATKCWYPVHIESGPCPRRDEVHCPNPVLSLQRA